MDLALTAEDRLLLLCARVELDAQQRAGLARLAAEQVDWNRLLARATRHGISTLLRRHLKGHNTPAPVQDTLEAATRMAGWQVLQQRAEALRLLDALARAGIEVIALKGLALREQYYPDPALRPSGDLDLLLHAEEVTAAEALLREMGYRPDETELPADWYPLHHFHHIVPYRLPERNVQVELHTDLFEPGTGVQVDLEGIWGRAVKGTIDGRPVRLLCPDDLLLHLAVHACASSRFRTGLRHLVDLGQVAGRDRGSLSWAAVGERARSWQAAEYLYLSLRTAVELIGSPELEEALPPLRPEGFDERLVAAACRRVLGLTLGETRPAISDNLGHFLRSASCRDKLGWLQRSLFPSPARIASLYGVAPGSWRIWPRYVARPFELLARYMRVVSGVAARRPEASAAADAKAEQLRLDEWLAPRQ